MKMSFKWLALVGLAIALSGCAACRKNTECASSGEQYVAPVATPVVAEPVAPAAPVAEEPAAPVVEEPAQEKYPRAVLK